ncbi:hypothetical protein [Paenibacillus sp. PDC88]|uniref:hypothetical protein n=1 Tax=Paenibacillus sp. PDC88 TaxID=1884375 RepID=UPI0008950371|nr:hypothetical protein [Paenibacillus sp. PDC88]SDX04870.1 hypothetical protein SAMN05518848_104189 [Paenibacillus sp. PDC88]
MYDWEDEQFYEPSPYDGHIETLIQAIRADVKEGIISEMNRLKKENAELQDVKRDFEAIKREYEQKKIELEYAKHNVKNEVRRERLVELMGDFTHELYKASSKRNVRPKCDKCDERRMIHYTSPLGNPKQEDCDCKNGIAYYEPRSYLCSSYEVRNSEFIAWYKAYEIDADGMEFEFITSSSTAKIIYAGEDFEKLEDYHYIHFKSKEDCQRYCDWLTAKEAEKVK